MRPIPITTLWIGNVGDLDSLTKIFEARILAIIDLAINEAPSKVNRELVYCRFPLLDSPGNLPWIIEAAVDTVEKFARAKIPTLIFCSAGLSRSPLIAAAALARIHACSLADAVKIVADAVPMDLSPGLYLEVQKILGLS